MQGPVQAFMGPGSALAPSFELLSNIFSFPVTLTPPPANFPPTDALRLSLLGVEQSPGKNKELSPQVRMPKLAQKAHFREKKRLVIKTKAFICKPREVICVCVCVCVCV